MTDEGKKRQMQEALDATLQPDAYRKLLEDTQQDPKTADTFAKLQDVDTLLKDARHQPRPAPSRLADSIMAKIANPENLPVPQPLTSGRSLAIGLAITAAVLLPVLLILSLLVLATLGSGSAVSGAALGVVAVALGLYTALNSMMSFAGSLLSNNPLIITLLLLIPLGTWGLHRLSKPWNKERPK